MINMIVTLFVFSVNGNVKVVYTRLLGKAEKIKGLLKGSDKVEWYRVVKIVGYDILVRNASVVKMDEIERLLIDDKRIKDNIIYRCPKCGNDDYFIEYVDAMKIGFKQRPFKILYKDAIGSVTDIECAECGYTDDYEKFLVDKDGGTTSGYGNVEKLTENLLNKNKNQKS